MKLGPCFELMSFVAAWICGLAIATGAGRDIPREDRMADGRTAVGKDRAAVGSGRTSVGGGEPTAMK